MYKRVFFLLASLVGCALASLVIEQLPQAYGQEAKAPDWKYGLVFRVRKADQGEFENAQRIGSEIFVDKNGGNALYISYPGSLAAAPAASLSVGNEVKAPKWLHGLKLKCRKAGEQDFDKAQAFGI